MAKKRHHKSSRPSPSSSSRPTAVASRPPGQINRSNGRQAKAPLVRPTQRAWWPVPRQYLAGIVAVVVVVLVAAVGVYYLSRQTSGTPAAATGSPVAQQNQQDLLGVPVPDEGRSHVTEGSAITYQHNPPASGPHYPEPKPWGVYTETIAPGYWVHNLEHGGVVLLYDCPSGCPSVVDQLRQAYQTFPKDKYNEVKLLATPYSGLPNHAQAMAVSWGFQKSYDTFDLQAFQAFYSAHVDHSPEDVP